MTRSTTRRRRAPDLDRFTRWLSRPEMRRIRAARVLTAQARIASGHYDRPEVRDTLVDILLEELRRH